jgi:hypothetical protein
MAVCVPDKFLWLFYSTAGVGLFFINLFLKVCLRKRNKKVIQFENNRSRKSQDRQYDFKTKGQTMIYKTLHRKLMIEKHESH